MAEQLERHSSQRGAAKPEQEPKFYAMTDSYYNRAKGQGSWPRPSATTSNGAADTAQGPSPSASTDKQEEKAEGEVAGISVQPLVGLLRPLIGLQVGPKTILQRVDTVRPAASG